MNFDYSEKVETLRAKLLAFMDECIYPNEKTYHDQLEASADRWQAVSAAMARAVRDNAGSREK